MGAGGGPARELCAGEHRAVRDDLPRGIQGPSGRRGGASGPRLARYHGRRGGRCRQALGPHPHIWQHAIDHAANHRLEEESAPMKTFATLLTLVMLSLTLTGSEALA